jgi:hypothetical protein
MPQQTLISAWEVVKYSPESNKFPTAYVEPHIYHKEQQVAREYLGLDFWDLLLADKVDYGLVENWDDTTTYASGDYVDYYGTVLESIQDDNTVDPVNDLANDYWIEAPKFETACYQSLWEVGGLRDFLAFFIIVEAFQSTTNPAGGKGLTEWIDDGGQRDGAGSRSASASTQQNRINGIRGQAEVRQKNMQIWMIRQHEAETCLFTDALPIASCYIKPVQQPRRIAYRKYW